MGLLCVALMMGWTAAVPAEQVAQRVRVLPVEDVRKAGLGAFQIVDARPVEAFAAGHLAGARSMPWDAWTMEAPGVVNLVVGQPAHWGLVPPEAQVESRLQALGLEHGKAFLVVGSPAAWGDEGRVAWNLLYWGARDVALLDGGMEAWQAAGGAVEAGAAKLGRTGSFKVHPVAWRRALLADVKRASSTGGVLLDARTAEEFAGETVHGQARGGHIPGARLVPHRSLYDATGRYVDAAALKALEPDVGGGKVPITYCTGGVRSALLAVLLEARLGVRAANYDGSMWEWAAQPDTAVVEEQKKAGGKR